MDRALPHEGQTYAVLDIETKPDGHAAALLRQGEQSRIPSAAHKIVAASILLAREEPDGSWNGFRLETPAEPELDEPAILHRLDAILLDIAEGGICVSFNGLSHDLPTIQRRAARHLMFEAAGIHAVGAIRHVDLMRRMTRGWRDDWPSLKAACAGLGLPLNHALSPRGGGGLTAPERKCQTDVACTFVLLLYELAIARRSRAVLDRGWEGLANFVDNPHTPPHLAQFARHPVAVSARSTG